MGRKLRVKTVVFKFVDPSILDGLEAEFRRPKMNELMQLTSLESEETKTKDKVDLMMDLLGDLLVSWNQEDADGNPLPANAEGLGHLDDEEFHELLSSYTANTGGVSAPLGDGSSNGGVSPAPSAMTELSLLSQPN